MSHPERSEGAINGLMPLRCAQGDFGGYPSVVAPPDMNTAES